MERKTNIHFEPIEHKYTDDEGLVYTSVTTVIDKYKPKFNKRYWSMYVALRDNGFKVIPDNGKFKGITVDGFYRSLDSLYNNHLTNFETKLVLNKWDKLTEVACDRGNKIHDFLEDSINISKDDVEANTNDLIQPALQNVLKELNIDCFKTQHDLDKTTLKGTYPEIYNRLLMYIKMGCTLFAEKRIYSTTYQIAGMIDVLVVKGKKFCIVDWKTNKDILLFNSGYFKKKKIGNDYVKTSEFIPKKEYFYAPLGNIELCKGMTYTLQLSLYAFIMELWGYKLVENGLEIFHIREGLRPKLLKIAYKKDAVQKMLTHHLSKQVINKTKTKFGIK